MGLSKNLLRISVPIINEGVGLLRFSLPMIAFIFSIHCPLAAANPNLKPAIKQLFERLERTFVAVAFAEAGLFREASDVVDPAPVRKRSGATPSFLEVVGLQHAPARMYVMTT